MTEDLVTIPLSKYKRLLKLEEDILNFKGDDDIKVLELNKHRNGNFSILYKKDQQAKIDDAVKNFIDNEYYIENQKLHLKIRMLENTRKYYQKTQENKNINSKPWYKKIF